MRGAPATAATAVCVVPAASVSMAVDASAAKVAVTAIASVAGAFPTVFEPPRCSLPGAVAAAAPASSCVGDRLASAAFRPDIAALFTSSLFKPTASQGT